MTIRQLHNITDEETRIYIGWDGGTSELNRKNPLELDAYGQYKIGRILAMAENKIEADLLAQPVKEAI